MKAYPNKNNAFVAALIIFVALLVTFGVSSCQSDNPTELSTARQAREAAATPSPTVTSLSSVAACYNWPSSYPTTSVPIPWFNQKNQLIIRGTNFGDKPGQISITDLTGKSQSLLSYIISSWSNTSVTLTGGFLIASSTTIPIPTSLKIGLTTTDNRFVSTSFTAYPMISGRMTGSPSFYVNLKLVRMGLQPEPYSGYTPTSGTLGDNYSPRVGDVWIFNGQESVIISLNSSTQNLSKNTASRVDLVSYNTTGAEWANGTGVSVGNGFTYKVTTTYYSNGTSKVTSQLQTPPASAFTSAVRSAGYAKTYYRP